MIAPTYSRNAVIKAARERAGTMRPLSCFGRRWLSGNLVRPNQREVLSRINVEGFVSGFRDLKERQPHEFEHTLRVCEALEHFSRADFRWYYDRMESPDVEYATYARDFGAFQRQWMGLSEEDRRAFPAIALLHDVGKIVDPTHFHDEASAILVKRILGGKTVSPRYREFVTNVVQYHLLMGSLVTRLSTPASVLSYLHELARTPRSLRRYFTALLIFNMMDVAGYGKSFPHGMLIRYQQISTPRKLARLGQNYLEARLEVLCRTFEESAVRRMGQTEMMPTVMEEIARAILPEERERFEGALASEIDFHGINRTLIHLNSAEQVRLLRLVIQIKWALEKADLSDAKKTFVVMMTDPMKKGYLDPVTFAPYQAKVRELLAAIPERCAIQDVSAELARTSYESVFGFPLEIGDDLVHINFAPK